MVDPRNRALPVNPFRVGLPQDEAGAWSSASAEGGSGCILPRESGKGDIAETTSWRGESRRPDMVDGAQGGL
jgi:hypothetical protein